MRFSTNVEGQRQCQAPPLGEGAKAFRRVSAKIARHQNEIDISVAGQISARGYDLWQFGHTRSASRGKEIDHQNFSSLGGSRNGARADRLKLEAWRGSILHFAERGGQLLRRIPIAEPKRGDQERYEQCDCKIDSFPKGPDKYRTDRDRSSPENEVRP